MNPSCIPWFIKASKELPSTHRLLRSEKARELFISLPLLWIGIEPSLVYFVWVTVWTTCPVPTSAQVEMPTLMPMVGDELGRRWQESHIKATTACGTLVGINN